MKHLRKFLNFAACAGVILSIATLASCGSDDNDEPDNGGSTGKYQAVDLGLPSGTKWATMNVGAEKPSDFGEYFAWGDTKPSTNYVYENCITCGLDIDVMVEKGIIDAETENLTANWDAATANWGSDWRMPTGAERYELVEECDWEWTTVDGHEGYKVTGPNGKSIFLPAAGYYKGTELKEANVEGHYWSSSPWSYMGSGEINFSINYVSSGDTNRYEGFTVRPVRK